MFQDIDQPSVMGDFNAVLEALKGVRLPLAGMQETAIHDELSKTLMGAGIAHKREHKFGPRCRADLWVDGIAIEVKKMRPPRAALLEQINRYAQQSSLRALIVVLERSVLVPASIEGKPVSILSLNALWGIAL